MKEPFRLTFILSLVLLVVIFVAVFHEDLVTKANRFQYKTSDTADTADTADSDQKVQRDLQFLLKDEYIRERHAGCFAKSMYVEKEKDKVDYQRVWKYSLLGKNVTKSVRYNHLCPWMKNRYNCATSKTDIKYGESATDWKMILESETDQCDLWQLAHDIGGPVGLANILVQRRVQDTQRRLQNMESVSSEKNVATEEWLLEEQKRTMYNVVFFGNSYLRQIIEAFLCSWSHEITHSLSQKGAHYGISVADMAARNGALIRMDELGVMERMPMPWEGEGCKLKDIDHFYDKDVMRPRECDGFDDNIFMVEFGNVLRIAYIFHPINYEDIPALLEMVHLQPKTVDTMIMNDNSQQIFRNDLELRDRFSVTGAYQRRIMWGTPYARLETFQNRDIGRWFGADNPWTFNPPDGHACMPGPPDDEVNFILHLLYSNSRVY